MIGDYILRFHTYADVKISLATMQFLLILAVTSSDIYVYIAAFLSPTSVAALNAHAQPAGWYTMAACHYCGELTLDIAAIS